MAYTRPHQRSLGGRNEEPTTPGSGSGDGRRPGCCRPDRMHEVRGLPLPPIGPRGAGRECAPEAPRRRSDAHRRLRLGRQQLASGAGPGGPARLRESRGDLPPPDIQLPDDLRHDHALQGAGLHTTPDIDPGLHVGRDVHPSGFGPPIRRQRPVVLPRRRHRPAGRGFGGRPHPSGQANP